MSLQSSIELRLLPSAGSFCKEGWQHPLAASRSDPQRRIARQKRSAVFSAIRVLLAMAVSGGPFALEPFYVRVDSAWENLGFATAIGAAQSVSPTVLKMQIYKGSFAGSCAQRRRVRQATTGCRTYSASRW